MTALLLLACTPPDASALFGDVATHVETDPTAADGRFIAVIDSAETALAVALPAGQNPEVTDAIIAAWDRGVDVEVVTDLDRAGDPGIVDLSDAQVPLRLADGALTYFDFAINLDVAWTSDQITMSHAFAVADQERIVLGTAVATGEPGPRVVFEARGEDLVEDLLLEFNQVFGGSDATALTAFSNPAKSVVDARWRYGTTDETTLGVWFGPQERLVKRVIDGVYGARSSVRILTDDLSNDGLARALQAKAANGFPVSVVVGPRFGLGSSAQARELEDGTPDVEKYKVEGTDHLPTLVLIDLEETRLGQRANATAMVITHDLLSSSRTWLGTEVETDQLVDGAMFSLSSTDAPGEALSALLALFEDERDAGEPL
jgi:phosphatidylserine/phosphatidylglycerophosphate/cardiolipin synthase-like enzyme